MGLGMKRARVLWFCSGLWILLCFSVTVRIRGMEVDIVYIAVEKNGTGDVEENGFDATKQTESAPAFLPENRSNETQTLVKCSGY